MTFDAPVVYKCNQQQLLRSTLEHFTRQVVKDCVNNANQVNEQDEDHNHCYSSLRSRNRPVISSNDFMINTNHNNS